MHALCTFAVLGSSLWTVGCKAQLQAFPVIEGTNGSQLWLSGRFRVQMHMLMAETLSQLNSKCQLQFPVREHRRKEQGNLLVQLTNMIVD